MNMGLGNQGFAYQAIPGTEGWGQGMFGGLAAGASALLGNYAMSKIGGMFGGGGGGASTTTSQIFAAENNLG